MKLGNQLSIYALATVAALSSQVSANAGVLGAKIYVQNTGTVEATFIGQTAGYDNELFLDSPTASGRIFHNHLNSPGDTKSLGSFNAGDELIFRLYVVNTGNTFFSGPADRNPDQMAHAMVTDEATHTVVGFEDLFGGGDMDYDDTLFSFTNVRRDPPTHKVPDASSTLPLLSMGMAGVAYLRRRFAK